MGWSYFEFWKLWTVITNTPKSSDWSRQALEEIDGKGTMGRIWVELKDEGKSRCEKRKTLEDL